MPIARVGEVDLYYEVHGEGAPVVLIGGLGGAISMLAAIVERLARTSLVLAFDNRGTGRSSMSGAPGSIETMAADAVGVMDAAGVAAAHVVGISMGGSIALAVALAHPERVRGLVLVSAGARTPRRTAWLPAPSAPRLRRRRASPAYDCTGRLGEIVAPTLILWGRRDRTVRRHVVEELHDGIAGSKLVRFDGGHTFFLRRERAAFLDQVEAFVRSFPHER